VEYCQEEERSLVFWIFETKIVVGYFVEALILKGEWLAWIQQTWPNITAAVFGWSNVHFLLMLCSYFQPWSIDLMSFFDQVDIASSQRCTDVAGQATFQFLTNF